MTFEHIANQPAFPTCPDFKLYGEWFEGNKGPTFFQQCVQENVASLLSNPVVYTELGLGATPDQIFKIAENFAKLTCKRLAERSKQG